MTNLLLGLKVAILVANGFELSELEKPKKALENEGAIVEIISPEKSKVQSWNNDNWSKKLKVDIELSLANANKYDALVLPGGVMNPDKLRIIPDAIKFIKEFVINEKPIAAICHGPWTLINAQAVKGKKLTSWPSLELDLKNAGADWIDEEVVVDDNLVTSRKPEDIPAFNREMIKLFSTKK
ncbi:MAG: type 1 glutamine amidotransferase [Candidatus Babeliales bacterium]|nr:type 1 glutamine amidotransferase [Candidatus Babeliales bacterium]